MTEDEANRDTYPQQVRALLWRWVILLAFVGLFALWATWRMGTAAARLPELGAGQTASATTPEVEYWTCTMHPDVQAEQPGECPRCGMELVPKYAGSDEPGVMPAVPSMPSAVKEDQAAAAESPKVWYKCTMAECNDQGSPEPSRCPVCNMQREQIELEPDGAEAGRHEITLSKRAQRLAELAVEPVTRRHLSKHIRTVGRIDYDETRHKIVSAWTGGRIDRLFADFTGMVVSKGEHLVEIYSPELLSAQEELLQARQAAEAIGDSTLPASRRGADRLLAAARRKLELLGVKQDQIEELIRTGQAQTHLVIYAPIGGTIVHKRAMEGMYVKTGDPLYDIADLTHVWLMIEVYEADLPWVRPMQNVRVTATAFPGQEFHGQIAFVDPVVDETTRTVRVRVNVDNPQRRLKPRMFVTAELQVPMAPGGVAAMPAPAGGYACPMHPWEQADGRAACPICEMDMVPITSIPAYAEPVEPADILSVPREAVMQTGQRALAYVEVEPGRYRGVEIRIGPLASDESGRQFYPVLSGPTEGEPVVTRGNFVIDSQMQIAGKPSLFHARGPGPAHADRHAGPPAKTTSPEADEDAAQTMCPVMGGEIDREVFTDYRGVRVYFCCEPCIARFLAEPDRYIPRLPPAVRERIARAPAKQAQEDHRHD